MANNCIFQKEFINWLDDHADQIDKESCAALAINWLSVSLQRDLSGLLFPRRAQSLRVYDLDVIEVLKGLACRVWPPPLSWGQGPLLITFLKSNHTLREASLEGLCQGNIQVRQLSNTVKFLSDLEELNISINEEDGNLYLKGHRLPRLGNNARADRFLSIFDTGSKTGATSHWFWLYVLMRNFPVQLI